MIRGTMGAVTQLYTMSMGIPRPFAQYRCTTKEIGPRLNSLWQIPKSSVAKIPTRVMDEKWYVGAVLWRRSM